MDGLRDYHTKSERERQIPYDITYMQNLKYDTNELTYKTETDSQRTDLWLPRGSGVGRGMNQEFNGYKLLHIEWINSKFLLYSTGKYSQHPVINHSGREYERMCICITASLYCTVEINTAL